jgi:hypothetical protein
VSLLLLLGGGGPAGIQRVASRGCYHLETVAAQAYTAAVQRNDHYQAMAAAATLYAISFGKPASYETIALWAAHYTAETEAC